MSPALLWVSYFLSNAVLLQSVVATVIKNDKPPYPGSKTEKVIMEPQVLIVQEPVETTKSLRTSDSLSL